MASQTLRSNEHSAVLLSCCGPSTFRLLRSLVLPTPLTELSFKDLVAKMKAHREPKPSVIVQRYQFNSRQRSTSETVAEYVAAFRKPAEHCNFGDTLDEMLRDRLVCGIANAAVQKRLLTEPELTFTKAVTIAQAVELAEKGSRGLQSVRDPPKDIHKFSHLTNSKKSSHKQVDVGKDKSSTGNCIAVVESITSPHVGSSLKCAAFVISEDILQKCVRAE